jgi:hypothetical protein
MKAYGRSKLCNIFFTRELARSCMVLARRRTGEYFYKRQPIAPSPTAQDDRVAALLWERSAALAGLNA